jgi:hypothetical protein
LAPKVYGCKFKNPSSTASNKKEVVKVKGFKNILLYKNLKTLLQKDTVLHLNHEK